MPGLNSITSLMSSVATVEENLDNGNYTKDAVVENEKDIVRLNVDQLYLEGINSLGVSIDSYAPYSPLTIKMKTAKGQPVDRVTLRDTGDFHRGFHVVADSGGFIITSSDGKTDDLMSKYRGSVFGLTKDNKGIASQIIYPSVLQKIRQEIFK